MRRVEVRKERIGRTIFFDVGWERYMGEYEKSKSSATSTPASLEQSVSQAC